jgi:hypothetical protein
MVLVYAVAFIGTHPPDGLAGALEGAIFRARITVSERCIFPKIAQLNLKSRW